MNQTILTALKQATSFEELEKVLSDYNIPDRTDLSEEESKIYVEKCFAFYEKAGFTESFHPSCSDWKGYDGAHFKVLGRVSADKADLECLPMWTIQFTDGIATDVFPEEICKLEVNEHDVYRSNYDAFDLYVAGFDVGDKAFVYNKNDKEWLEGIVSNVVESKEISDGEIPFTSSYTGEIVTADESYHIGIQTSGVIDKPALNIICFF